MRSGYWSSTWYKSASLANSAGLQPYRSIMTCSIRALLLNVMATFCLPLHYYFFATFASAPTSSTKETYLLPHCRIRYQPTSTYRLLPDLHLLTTHRSDANLFISSIPHHLLFS